MGSSVTPFVRARRIDHKPAVLISGDASTPDKDGNATVFVTRLVLGGEGGSRG